MAADPLATVDDLAAFLGTEITGDPLVGRADLLLRSASALIRSFAGADRVADGGEKEEEGFLVCLAAAARPWNNPDGTTQETDTLGSFTHSASFSTGDGIFLTASEKAMLRRKKSGLWSQPTTRVDHATPDLVVVPVEGGSDMPFDVVPGGTNARRRLLQGDPD